MSSIIIREKDETSAGTAAVSNAVYVPGYATRGPINEPTLCNTVAEFKDTFGNAPYVFTFGSEYPSFKFNTNAATPPAYKAGDMEKSWIYAAECLQKGLPVVYERIMPEAKIPLWCAEGTITRQNAGTTTEGEAVATIKVANKFAGKFGEAMKAEITKEADPVAASNYSAVYKIKFEIDGKAEEQKFSFNQRDDYPAPDTVLFNQINDYLEYATINWDTTFISEVESAISGATINTILLFTGEKRNFSLGDRTEDEFQVQDIYTQINNSYDLLTDRDEYDVMFISSGAYPMFLVWDNMAGEVNTSYVVNQMTCAATRHDAVALVDFANLPYDLKGDASIYAYVNDSTCLPNATSDDALGEDASVYSTLINPNLIMSCTSVNKNLPMPSSLGYLLNFASSSGQNPAWFAVAGGQRGPVVNLVNTIQNVTGNIANTIYQQRTGRAINPIYTVKPYGKCLWGNRTLKNSTEGLTAQSFLNIRILCCVLKKIVYRACKSLTFEQNDDALWNSFRSKVTPTLDAMYSNRGIRGYSLEKLPSDIKGQVKGVIRIIPIEAVEDFDITIVLADSDASISE